VSIGEIGQFCRDFTAVGDVVNVAARLQGVAQPGEIVLTEEVYQQVAERYPEAEARDFRLKGLSRPVRAYTLKPVAAA
jgi:adenylate cyclase